MIIMFKKTYAITLIVLTPIILSLLSIPPFLLATPTTTLSIEPQIQTGLEISDEFTINVTVTDVTDLYGWQFAIYYKNSVLNATGYSEGPFLKQDGAQTYFAIVEYTDNYNETHGKIFLATSRVGPVAGVNGSGILARISFKTKAYGNSPLDLSETKLIDSAQPFGNPISHEAIDGRVHVGLVDIAIINVQAPLNIPKGNMALINVTVENQGRVTQTFDVTLKYDTTLIAPAQTVTNLEPTQNRTLTFPWDTTPVPIGEYTLTVKADEILGEIDTEDNTFTTIIYIGKRDIAITNTHLSKTVTNDTLVYINVTVTNNGEATATFNLTAYCDTNPIETKTNINLPAGATTRLTFTLNTLPLQKGVYTISTTATPTPGETNIVDNTFIDGIITETIRGDVTGDFKVDIYDIYQFGRAFDTTSGHPRWNPNCDLNNDGLINIYDIYHAAKNYGQEI
jgi:hypothetical protein